jgi:hypothetical protein
VEDYFFHEGKNSWMNFKIYIQRTPYERSIDKNPASISAYTQSEYRISNYVNHIRMILEYEDTWAYQSRISIFRDTATGIVSCNEPLLIHHGAPG